MWLHFFLKYLLFFLQMKKKSHRFGKNDIIFIQRFLLSASHTVTIINKHGPTVNTRWFKPVFAGHLYPWKQLSV